MHVDKLSPLVRGRLLFQDEVTFDSARNKFYDERFLERLVDRKAEVEAEQTKLFGGIISLTFLLYFVQGGADFTIPATSVSLGELPGLLPLLVSLLSLSLVISAITFNNVQAYDALIEQVIKSHDDKNLLDQDIIKSAYHKDWLIFKLLRADYSPDIEPRWTMKKPARDINHFLVNGLAILVLFPVVAILVYVTYVSIAEIENSVLGIITKIFSTLACLYAVLVAVAPHIGVNCEMGTIERRARP